MKNKNIIIYVVGVYALSILGALLISNKQSIGGLIFIISPILMTTTLRSIGRIGWESAGLKFRFKGNLKWYLISLFIMPFTIILLGLIGYVTGLLHLQNLNSSSIITLLQGSIPILIFCIFEEFGWRGFLEAELSKSKLSNNKRYLIVGIIWGGWHIPYYLVTNITNAPKPYHIVAMFIFCILSSFIYGYIRKKTNSVWPAVLMHGIGNILLTPIITEKIVIAKFPMLFDVQVYPIFSLILWAFMSFLILHRKKESVKKKYL